MSQQVHISLSSLSTHVSAGPYMAVIIVHSCLSRSIYGCHHCPDMSEQVHIWLSSLSTHVSAGPYMAVIIAHSCLSRCLSGCNHTPDMSQHVPLRSNHN